MIFHDPDTLRLWIDVFFAVAAASVALAFVALTVAVRDARRPALPVAASVTGHRGSDTTPTPLRQAA